MNEIGSQGLTRRLSEQARALSYTVLPDDVRTLVRQCLLDYVACTVAGAQEDPRRSRPRASCANRTILRRTA
jgi:2-methylcitrate dehydratase PrpD